ncbi:hypothetical protein A3196_16075 [Candidatus Thiodiazotropha endoloripes]|uniref:Uncharacterized protein n=1 Tax=Candidatus Thiodiazotropha endoloripes TaxID=1818881 RepID=A0A1E2UTQ0_9GAMM|nr:hypothetical protein A3196_16075 [Candidatus Thiodiazotropha endoloripes]
MSESPCFALLGESLFFSRQKKSNQKKRRPAVTPLRVRCDARQKPAGLKLAIAQTVRPANRFLPALLARAGTGDQEGVADNLAVSVFLLSNGEFLLKQIS